MKAFLFIFILGVFTSGKSARDNDQFVDYRVDLKKQNLKHSEFAKKSIQELFTPALLGSSVVKQFNYCSSIVALNQGNGQFIIQKLPFMVQLSSVNAIRPVDLNGDGHIDLVLGGNEFGFLPQFGRLDASAGHVLINDGSGKFLLMKQDKSGLDVPGQTRDIVEIKGKKKLYVISYGKSAF